jgi:hypothetical protein
MAKLKNSNEQLVTVYHSTNLSSAYKILQDGKIGISISEYKDKAERLISQYCDTLSRNKIMKSLEKRGFFCECENHCNGFDVRGGVSFWPSAKQIHKAMHRYSIKVAKDGGEYRGHLIKEIFKTIARHKKVSWREYFPTVKDHFDKMVGGKYYKKTCCDTSYGDE